MFFQKLFVIFAELLEGQVLETRSRGVISFWEKQGPLQLVAIWEGAKCYNVAKIWAVKIVLNHPNRWCSSWRIDIIRHLVLILVRLVWYLRCFAAHQLRSSFYGRLQRGRNHQIRPQNHGPTINQNQRIGKRKVEWNGSWTQNVQLHLIDKETQNC